MPVQWPAKGDPTPFLPSRTGLYLDIARQTLAPDLIAFQPAHPLWTDGAEKRRRLRLPPNAVTDTTNMDQWQLPLGAELFEEFRRDGVLVETRAIARLGPGRFDYWKHSTGRTIRRAP